MENKKPSWAKKLEISQENYVPSYKDLRDTYVFLRSSRRLLSGTIGILFQSPRNELELAFQANGFARTALLKQIVMRLSRVGLGPEVSYRDRQDVLNVLRSKNKDSHDEKRGKQYLKQSGRLTRARNWQYRLEVAIEQAIEQGWYPLFGTYTVDQKRLPSGCLSRDDLWKKTPAWDRFIKKFKTEVAQANGYGRRPCKWPINKEFFKYFAIIEHGKSGYHPHVHVIWLCKNIPHKWKIDPNRNCADQTEVDMPAPSALWQHGIQRRTQALFIVGSWFTDHWKLPRKSQEVPGKVGDAAAVAAYIGKYITKGETKAWQHRVKATKNLGIEKLTTSLKDIKSPSLLLSLACRPAKYLVSMKLQTVTSCPLNLIRERSRQELMKRLHSMKTTRARNLMKDQWTKRPNEFFMTYISSVRDGQKPWRLMPEQRYNLYTLMLEAVKSTVHCKQRTKVTLDWLCYNMQKRNPSAPFVLLKGEFAT